jgi:hypothetical protein
MGAPTRPEPVRAVHEVLLIHRLQHHEHGPLQDLVLEGRYPNRAGAILLLWDVHPPHRWRSVVLARLGLI